MEGCVRTRICQKLLASICLMLMPCTLMADTPPGGTLYVKETATVNGKTVSQSPAAVFPEDIVQTDKSEARIGFLGANVGIDQDTLVTMGTDFVRLKHGSLLIVDV